MKSYRVVDHGPEHEQYFQGHGTAFTKYTTCATGIGNTPYEALEDALEQLVMNGDITNDEADQIERFSDLSKESELEDDEYDWHHYVSVDVEK